jgi:hypothetical protein
VTARGLAPVVGKTLEAGIALLYVTGLLVALHGGVLPEYRAAAGAEVSDRVLVTAAERVESSVPPRGRTVDAALTVDLTDTIATAVYRIRAKDGVLVLDHPDPAFSGRLRLATPDRVAVEGSWRSDERTTVRVRSDDAGVRVILA